MNQHQIDRIALAIHALRPDWRADSLRTFIANQTTKAGLPLAQMPYRDLAVAFAWIATDDDTRLPTRILELGPWWEATQPNTPTTGPKTPGPPTSQGQRHLPRLRLPPARTRRDQPAPPRHRPPLAHPRRIQTPHPHPPGQRMTTQLTPGILMAAAATVATHGQPQSRDHIAAALIAEAERLDNTTTTASSPEPETTP